MTDPLQDLYRQSPVDYAYIVGAVADGMRWDPLHNQIVIDIPNHPDPTFPDDPDLDTGPLTYSVWRQALHQLADALPPWTEPS
jgi:hypothetical protein